MKYALYIKFKGFNNNIIDRLVILYLNENNICHLHCNVRDSEENELTFFNLKFARFIKNMILNDTIYSSVWLSPAIVKIN